MNGMRSQNRIIGECAGAEDSFFDIDKESNTARVLLNYDRRAISLMRDMRLKLL